jgi:hypothetical protein
VACAHASLQNFDPVRVQMRAVLQDIDISEIKAVEAEALSLDVPDAFTAGEEVRFRARCEGATESIRAIVSNVETKATITCRASSVPGRDGWEELDAGALPAGTYRIRVEAEDAEPFSDLFVILDAGATADEGIRV